MVLLLVDDGQVERDEDDQETRPQESVKLARSTSWLNSSTSESGNSGYSSFGGPYWPVKVKRSECFCMR